MRTPPRPHRTSIQKEDTRMVLPKIDYRAVAIIATVVAVIGFITLPVSAAPVFSSQGDPTGVSSGNSAHHHVFNSTQQAARLQTVLTNLSNTGVDVSQAQADLSAGNVNAAMQWLMTYHQAHPGTALNGTHHHVFNSAQSQQGGSFRSHHAGFGNKTESHSWFPAQGQSS